MKTYIIVSIIMIYAATGTFAQVRQPSSAIKPYVVRSKQSLADLDNKLTADKTDVDSKNATVTKVEDIIGGAGMETRVAVQHDTRRSGDLFELHDKSDDVYYVLKGEATLELGGTLVDPKEPKPGDGEWKAKTATGAQSVVIKEGDIVIVPRGTPHRRTVTGKGFSMILIKIYEDPLPGK